MGGAQVWSEMPLQAVSPPSPPQGQLPGDSGPGNFPSHLTLALGCGEDYRPRALKLQFILSQAGSWGEGRSAKGRLGKVVCPLEGWAPALLLPSSFLALGGSPPLPPPSWPFPGSASSPNACLTETKPELEQGHPQPAWPQLVLRHRQRLLPTMPHSQVPGLGLQHTWGARLGDVDEARTHCSRFVATRRCLPWSGCWADCCPRAFLVFLSLPAWLEWSHCLD